MRHGSNDQVSGHSRFTLSFSRSCIAAFKGARLWVVIVAYTAFLAWTWFQGYAAAARGEAPLFTDFNTFYAASLLVRNEPAEHLYLPKRMHSASIASAYIAYGDNITADQARTVGYSPWMHPPSFILFSLPLAYVPYLPSFFLWIGATLLPFFAALRSILPQRGAISFGLATPPAFFNLAFGQTGFLSGGLIGLGFARLLQNPILAGFFIGLASVKPHLGVLIPVALAAGGHWRTFAAATVTVAALVAVSILVLGADPWYGFIGSVWFYFDGFSVGAYTWNSMTSVLSTAHLAGATIEQAFKLQHLSAGVVVAITATIWYRGRSSPETKGLQAAVVCLGTPLAIPMVYLYDLVIIVPAMAWIWRDFCLNGARPWEHGVYWACTIGLLGTFLIAAYVGVQIGAACVAALFGIAIRRLCVTPRGAAPSPVA